jgi:hypothetical protein
LVAALVAVTLAPGITAPLGSFTVPEMLPVVAAQRIAGTIAANNAAQTNNVIRFRCTYPV